MPAERGKSGSVRLHQLQELWRDPGTVVASSGEGRRSRLLVCACRPHSPW